KGRVLAATTGHIVVAADPGPLGAFDTPGWKPSASGTAVLKKLSQLAHVPVAPLVTRIERAVVRAPFAPAVVVPRPTAPLKYYLDEGPTAYPGLKVWAVPSRLYPQGTFGSEFLG